jgi:alpha-tubulin suppressor-like RCC1 family protein
VLMSGGGRSHSCLLTNNKDVMCAGSDNYGQIGNGGVSVVPGSFSTVSLLAASTISVGKAHSCAMLVDDSSIQCWGLEYYGSLGDGGNTFVGVHSPVPATQLNAGGSANIQLMASWDNTYVDIFIVFQ